MQGVRRESSGLVLVVLQFEYQPVPVKLEMKPEREPGRVRKILVTREPFRTDDTPGRASNAKCRIEDPPYENVFQIELERVQLVRIERRPLLCARAHG